MSEEQLVTGGCLCGAVRFECKQQPFHVCYCHCGICRKSVGGVVSAWAFFPVASLKFTQGDPTWYASSATAFLGFCRTCGSPIGFNNTEYEHICIAHGALDNQDAYPPQKHWYLEDRLSFLDLQSGLESISCLPEA